MGRRQENIVGVVMKKARGWSDVRKGPQTKECRYLQRLKCSPAGTLMSDL